MQAQTLTSNQKRCYHTTMITTHTHVWIFVHLLLSVEFIFPYPWVREVPIPVSTPCKIPLSGRLTEDTYPWLAGARGLLVLVQSPLKCQTPNEFSDLALSSATFYSAITAGQWGGSTLGLFSFVNYCCSWLCYYWKTPVCLFLIYFLILTSESQEASIIPLLPMSHATKNVIVALD